MTQLPNSPEGILLVDKPTGQTSFSLVRALRKKLHVKKIGHSGTLDPFATGVMVLLVGRKYTRLANQFLEDDKEYVAEVHLGKETDSYDCDGQILNESPLIPTQEAIKSAIEHFQGSIQQIPPMFSAKHHNGKRLYDLAREGKTVERDPITVFVETTFLSYSYPHLTLRIRCSKGTYIRSIAQDIGQMLTCGAHLSALKRTRSGKFLLENCIDGELLFQEDSEIAKHLQKSPA